jgi:hypothetical protein
VAAVGVDRLIAGGAPAPGTFDGTLLDAAGQAALIEQTKACIHIGSLLADADAVRVALSSQAVACVADGIEGSGLFETFVRAAAASGPDQAIVANIVPFIESLAGCLTVPKSARSSTPWG